MIDHNNFRHANDRDYYYNGLDFYKIFLFNFFYSIFRGPKAPQNPWKSTTLEWTTPVEHVHGNWPGDLPTVHRWPYDYSKPGSEVDFIMQTEPLAEGEEEH